MSALRITKIVCPSCEGTGKFRGGLLNIPCMWCRGAIRVDVEEARRYADHIWMIAGGGFVLGDHDYSTKVEMEKKAEFVYTLTGSKAPWLSQKGAHP